MAPRKIAALASLAALTLLAGAKGQIAQCPISGADAQKADFSLVKGNCVADAADFCGPCACSLIDVFAPALAAAAASPEGAAALASAGADPVALATDVLTACVPNVLPAILAAGVPLSALEGLTSCDFTGSKGPVPACLTERVAAITGGSQVEAAAPAAPAEVSATDGGAAAAKAAVAEVEAAQGPSSLRVATVQQLPGGGVSVTLAGQLNDAASLLAAMARNGDLVAALPETEAADLERLAAAPESLGAAPETNAYLASLKNPVDAVALVSRLSTIDAAAPRVAPARGAASLGAPANADAAAASVSAASAAKLAGTALAGAAMAVMMAVV